MRAWWTGPLAFGALAVILVASQAARRPPVPLPVLGTVPDFSVVAHDGRPLTRGALAGRVWLAEFIFTRCAGQCPLMARQTQRLLEALQDVPMRAVSFTVDPAYDTPAVLAAYAQRYGAQPGQWDFATGDPAALRALAVQGFRLAVGEGGPPDEPITHSVRLVLVDRDGAIRGLYDATDDEAMARLRADARRLLAAP